MWRSRRRLFFIACGVAAVAAAAVLVWQGIQLTLLLERQAALVFQDSAAREARARLGGLERAVTGAEAGALQALGKLTADPPREAIARLQESHPILCTPFLLRADQTLAYPPHPGPVLASLANEEPPPEEYLRARRLALNPARQEEAMAALAALSAAPEMAGPWRLRARVGLAAVYYKAGRAAESARTYASIADDFREELREIARPSRIQIITAQALATLAAGDGVKARALVLKTLHSLADQGPMSLGNDDAALLLERSAALLPADIEADRQAEIQEFASELEELNDAHSTAACSLRFARMVRNWIVPRLNRGASPERFVEQAGSRHYMVAWSRGARGSSFSAVGFQMRPEAVKSILESALGSVNSEAATTGTGEIPLQVEQVPPPEGFQQLATLPGALNGYCLGLKERPWKELLGSARRPFRIALVLIAALGIFLAVSVVLGLGAIRREMFLARMKTEFAANVSHELKTPLALIRLFGETLFLGRISDPDRARKYCGIITRESERLTHLVNNILDFASIEAGRKTFELRSCDLGHVVRETMASYRFQLEERGFEVRLSVPGDLPSTLADPDGVAQALINLLNNAVKYSPDRKEVAVRVERQDETIRIAVADRGMGIPAADRKRVFEDFFRSRAARSLGTRGSGLGLTLVRRILDAHGGTIELSSVPGEGSTFTLVFPIRSRAAPPETDRSQNHEGN